MIINVRGMAGTGKSTAVQKIIAVAGKRIYKNKISNLNIYQGLHPHRHLMILGNYDSNKNMGCDGIKYIKQCQTAIEFFDDHNYDVIYEGMMHSNTTVLPRALASKGRLVEIVHIDQPVHRVKQSRQQRSLQRGNQLKTDTGILTPEHLRKTVDALKDCCTIHTVIDSTEASNLITQRLTHGERAVSCVITAEQLWDLQCKIAYESSCRNQRKSLSTDLFTVY